MPSRMFIEMQVDDFVTLRDSIGTSTCVAEQLIRNLQVLQCRRLHEYVNKNIYIYEYVPAPQHTAKFTSCFTSSSGRVCTYIIYSA